MTARAAARAALVGLALAVAPPATAGSPSGEALVQALRQGGFILYFRHAATDWSQQDRLAAEGDWTSCDPERMRQLSEEGRRAAERVGAAIRRLDVPVGRVQASPYCRARQTATRLALGPVETTSEVMNLLAAASFGGRDAVTERARRRLSRPPAPGTNDVIVAHGNVVRAATGAYPGEAGAVIFRPRPGAAPEVVAEVAAERWTALADRLAPAD